jgi:hypothetical protein
LFGTLFIYLILKAKISSFVASRNWLRVPPPSVNKPNANPIRQQCSLHPPCLVCVQYQDEFKKWWSHNVLYVVNTKMNSKEWWSHTNNTSRCNTRAYLLVYTKVWNCCLQKTLKGHLFMMGGCKNPSVEILHHIKKRNKLFVAKGRPNKIVSFSFAEIALIYTYIYIYLIFSIPTSIISHDTSCPH